MIGKALHLLKIAERYQKLALLIVLCIGIALTASVGIALIVLAVTPFVFEVLNAFLPIWLQHAEVRTKVFAHAGGLKFTETQ